MTVERYPGRVASVQNNKETICQQPPAAGDARRAEE